MRTKEQIKEYNRIYHLKNIEKIKERNKQRKIDSPNYTKEYYIENREILLEKSRIYNQNNPDKQRARAYSSRYRITIEDYDKMFKEQEGCCATCKQKFLKHADVDHNHITGKIRALLCHNCNISLGHYEKNKAIFDVYLKTYDS